MSNFSSILDRAPSEIEKPKPLPVGTYTCVVNGLPTYDKSSKKQTDFVRFNLKVLAAGEDVDADDLSTWMQKPDGTTRSLADTQIRHDLYLTEDAAWRLKDFLTHLGWDIEDSENGSMRQMIEQSAGRQVNVFMRHEASQDGTSVFAKVGSTAAVEE